MFLFSAPRRFSALSLLRSLALLPISFCLMSLPAHAGTWAFTVTNFTWSHTFNGQNFGTAPKGPGAEIYVGGGLGNSSNTVQATEQVTFTGTWSPNPNITGDTPPPSVIVEVQTTAESNGIVNGKNTPGTDANDGYGDPINSYGISGGTHYMVETGSSFTVNLSMHASYANPSGFAYASVGGVAVSIVNGNWDGPYYFHYGNNSSGNGATDGPWPNNTAGPTPAITDFTFEKPKSSSELFTLVDNGSSECLLQGSITPVWFWNGPYLGVAPPGFLITVTTNATCIDFNAPYTDATVDDGLENTNVTTRPNSQETRDTDTRSVMVQSDDYAPGEGHGFWALGPTVHMKAKIDQQPVTGDLSLYSAIVLTASISGPSQ